MGSFGAHLAKKNIKEQIVNEGASLIGGASLSDGASLTDGAGLTGGASLTEGACLTDGAQSNGFSFAPLGGAMGLFGAHLETTTRRGKCK